MQLSYIILVTIIRLLCSSSNNIINLLNLNENADPNVNFDLFMKHFMNLKQESYQKKLVRFDKNNHKINP